jgi:hypothetical protein
VTGLRANGPWVCKPCRLGYSTENLTGAAQCTACSPGSYADKIETHVCELCDPGKRRGGLCVCACVSVCLDCTQI